MKYIPKRKNNMYLEKQFPEVVLQVLTADKQFDTMNVAAADGWKVIYFYPKDFTFVCPTEIVDFDNHVEEFAKLGATVYGVSPDNEYCHLAWRDSHPDLKNLRHTLVADSGNQLAGMLNIVSDEGVPFRATFIVDPEGVIKHASMNGLNVGRNAEETLRLLDSTQNGEEGMKCAANRKVGGKVIDI
jgi:alkyl hydroperoxide reductase subunit AhpC